MNEGPVRASAAENDSDAVSLEDADGDQRGGERWLWSYRNLLASAAPPRRLSWIRIVAWSLALALHLLMLLRMTLPPSAWQPAAPKDVVGAANADRLSWHGLRIVFVEPAAIATPQQVAVEAVVMPPVPTATPQPPPTAPRKPATPKAAPATATSEPRPAAAPASPATEPSPTSEEAAEPVVNLFLGNGTLALPEAVIKDLRAVESEDRSFDFKVPGLATAGAAFKRPPPIEYTPTRFDADWKPVRTLGEDLVMPVVEALTFENKRKTARCSLIPPGCSWGRTDPGHELNDPTTLNAAEVAQCNALWDAIVAATDQAEWLTLRARFAAECRMPEEKDDVPPAPRAAETRQD